MDLSHKTPQASIKFYVWLLTISIVLVGVFLTFFLNWLDMDVVKRMEIANDYHLATLKHSAKLQEEGQRLLAIGATQE